MRLAALSVVTVLTVSAPCLAHDAPSTPRVPAAVLHAGIATPGASPSPLAWGALAVFGSLVATLRARRDDRCEPTDERSSRC